MNTSVIEFVVLTGFLGSGKTTLLADFLATPEAADTAVIVNEVGEIGLDGAILAESGSEIPMAMLANGCICCQAGSDLAATIHALVEAKRPNASTPLRRIILETSGLSKPGPILRQLADLASLRMRIAVIATYDAIRGNVTANFEEAAAQWAAAHRIVATKLDDASSPQAQDVALALQLLNPLAEIVSEPNRNTAVEMAFAALAARSALPIPIETRTPGHSRIAVRLVTPIGTPLYSDLTKWLDNLGGVLGERLLRLKGVVRIADHHRPLLVQSVGTLFSMPRPIDPDGVATSSFLVVIARDLKSGELEAVAPAGKFLVMR